MTLKMFSLLYFSFSSIRSNTRDMQMCARTKANIVSKGIM